MEITITIIAIIVGIAAGFLIAKAADNTALVSLIQKNTQIDVRLLLPLNPSSPPSSKPTSSRAPEPL